MQLDAAYSGDWSRIGIITSGASHKISIPFVRMIVRQRLGHMCPQSDTKHALCQSPDLAFVLIPVKW